MGSFLRLLKNLLLLVLATVGGWVVRTARRVSGMSPRIWHGMFDSHLIPLQVSADHAAGFPSRSVVTRISGLHGLSRQEEFTVVLEAIGIPNNALLWAGLFDLLWKGDIWVSFFDGLFYPVERDWENRFILRLLALVGIRTVMVNYGGDVVVWSGRRGRYDWISRLALDYPHWDIKGTSAATRRRVDLFCKHAHFVCNGDSSIDRMMPRRDLLFKYFPVDCTRITPVYEARNPLPVIVHAPQHRMVKGTDYLLGAVESLRAKGFEFELQLVERVPHAEALAIYAKGDIIADQFCIGAWGTFAQEAMALGKPVLTYLDQEHLGDPAFNLPLVNTNPENLERVLAVLLSVPELRERLGRAGRAAVERYHSKEAIGAVWGQIYRHVWLGAPLQLESTDHFEPARQKRSFTEDPSDPLFWPVAVDDLLLVIRRAVTKVMAETGRSENAE